jgi:hypothetical protein
LEQEDTKFYMHSNLNIEDRTTSITSSSSNTATCDPYGPTVTLSMMPVRENIQINDKLLLHSTVEPPTADPARETAPKADESGP